MLFVIVNEIQNRHGDDEEVTQETQAIGHLTEQEEADYGREKDLRIVIDSDFSSGGIGIGSGDGELTACTAQTAADEHT